MKKSDKKLDNQLRQSLTQLCEAHLKTIDGFEWLTHQANFSRFPDSLKVVCVFSDNQALEQAKQKGELEFVAKQLNATLQKQNINLKNINTHLVFDTEEDCELQNKGNWAKRLTQY